VDIFKHTAKKNKKIKRAGKILPEVYGTTLKHIELYVHYTFPIEIFIFLRKDLQKLVLWIVNYFSFNFKIHSLGRKPVMVIGMVLLLISMGTRPLLPNIILVTIVEFFNGIGSMISFMSP
jgi:hypothetical protein